MSEFKRRYACLDHICLPRPSYTEVLSLLLGKYWIRVCVFAQNNI